MTRIFCGVDCGDAEAGLRCGFRGGADPLGREYRAEPVPLQIVFRRMRLHVRACGPVCLAYRNCRLEHFVE